ncbi:MAG: L,D-transpeptidase family protein [Acidobacteriota bacterium]
MAVFRIEIDKSKRKLSVFDGDVLAASFDVAFGSEPTGTKSKQGDGRTPENDYGVCVKNPKSKYHLSLCLNYPNIADAERGLAHGLISQDEHDAIVAAVKDGKLPPQDTALGGEIYIHGGGTDGDWTRGCIALTDADMTELFDIVETGTPVSIRQ